MESSVSSSLSKLMIRVPHFVGWDSVLNPEEMSWTPLTPRDDAMVIVGWTPGLVLVLIFDPWIVVAEVLQFEGSPWGKY